MHRRTGYTSGYIKKDDRRKKVAKKGLEDSIKDAAYASIKKPHHLQETTALQILNKQEPTPKWVKDQRRLKELEQQQAAHPYAGQLKSYDTPQKIMKGKGPKKGKGP